MRKIKYMRYLILLAVLTSAMVYMISLPTAVFAAVNVTNENITTNVTISNTNPTVDTVTLKDADGSDPLDLSADTSVVMNCSGIAGDFDGVGDISLNATLYHTDSSSGLTDDFTKHYTSNGYCTELSDINTTHLNYNCHFDVVWFHANTGTWTCNVTAWDSDSGQGDNQDSAEMAQLLAIDVDNADVDFGSMAIGTDKGTTDYNVTVYNDGNVDLDLNVQAWGVTDGDGLIMNCDDSNISERFLRVGWTSGEDWDNKKIVNNTGFDNSTFDLAESTVTSGTAGNSANKTTYWGLGIPTTDTNKYYLPSTGVYNYTNNVSVDGDCSGTISFTALVGE